MPVYVVLALAASVWALIAVAYFLSGAARTWTTRASSRLVSGD